MKYIIVGIGNPGEEYEQTRHNAGRLAVIAFSKKYDVFQWKKDEKINGAIAHGIVGEHDLTLVVPDTFMNLSGKAVTQAGVTEKTAGRLVVIYDDIDLPLGTLRISFGRGTGGHRGIDSIIKSVNTKDFIRIRIGIAPTTPSGKIKKPRGKESVYDFLLTNFTPKEEMILKKIAEKAGNALEVIITRGYHQAMNEFN